MNKRTRMLLSAAAVVVGTVLHYIGRDDLSPLVMALGITLEVVGVVSFLMAVAKRDAH